MLWTYVILILFLRETVTVVENKKTNSTQINFNANTSSQDDQEKYVSDLWKNITILAPFKIDLINKYDDIEEDGSGTFGSLFEAFYNNNTVALKVIEKILNVSSLNIADGIYAEIKALNYLNYINCPVTPKFIEAFQDETNVYISTENLKGGTLKALFKNFLIHRSQYMKINSKMENEARYLAATLFYVIRTLHKECHILHRDLSFNNIGFDENGKMKLLDFGSSQLLNDSSYKNVFGMDIYFPPEYRYDGKWSPEFDIWSVGVNVVLYFIRLNEYVNLLKYENWNNVLKNSLLKKGLSEAGVDFITKILQVDPKERFKYNNENAVKNHSWFLGNGTTYPAVDIDTVYQTLSPWKDYFEKHEEPIKIEGLKWYDN